jgi:hypothetical protein
MITGDALLAKVKELTIMKPTKPVSQEQSIARTQRGMTDKEQLIRVKILPQLESLSDDLFDYYCSDDPALKYMVRKLDQITEELVTILNE